VRTEVHELLLALPVTEYTLVVAGVTVITGPEPPVLQL
jgi:hypothetical protein